MKNTVFPFTLQQAWRDFTAKYADLPALGYVDERQYRYAELAERIKTFSVFFQNQGLKPGNRIALLSDNSPEWAMCYFAINNIGAVIVPILPDFPAKDVTNILEHSGSAAIVVCRSLKSRTKGAPAACRVFELEDLAALPKAKNRPKEQRVAENDTACIIYTSGTTGQSKGVMLSNKNLVWNACASKDIPPIHQKHRLLSILPLSHTYECTLGMLLPLISGAHVQYIKGLPSASILLPALAHVRPHLMLSVPLLIEKIYRQSVLPRFSGDNLTARLYRKPLFRRLFNRLAGRKLKRMFGRRLFFFGIGGAALDPDVEQFLVEAKFPYAIGYGLTETSPLIAGANAKKSRYRSTGPILPGLEVKIINTDEKGVGEIAVRGPSVMQGYYKNEEKTREVLKEDGWFHTGDLGQFGKNGYLYIKGRLKNLIIGPSGENIYPESIEALINNMEFVEESLVYHEDQSIVARIRLNYEALTEAVENLAESASHIPEDIGEYLQHIKDQVNRQLAMFSRLHRVIEQKEEFEKTPTKKIRRFLYTEAKEHAGEKSGKGGQAPSRH